MDTPLYSNKYTIATNVQKDEFTIDFYLERPKLDADNKNFTGIENIHLTTVVLNGRLAEGLVKSILELKDAEVPEEAVKE